jgi:RimJ/RimL family protein N-acetyltransferase
VKTLDFLKTERTIAHPISYEDLQELCEMHQDPVMMKYMGGIRTAEETKRWLGEELNRWKTQGFGLWIFHLDLDESLVGRCGLRRVQLDGENVVELGYAVTSLHWGMGLATEMANAIIAVWVKKLELTSVILLADAANASSRRVAEKLGFHFERNTIWKSLPTMLYRLDVQERLNQR